MVTIEDVVAVQAAGDEAPCAPHLPSRYFLAGVVADEEFDTGANGVWEWAR